MEPELNETEPNESIPAPGGEPEKTRSVTPFTEEEKEAMRRYVDLVAMAKSERNKVLARHTIGTINAYIARLRSTIKKAGAAE